MSRTFLLFITGLAWTSPAVSDPIFELAQRVGASIGIAQQGACDGCHAMDSRDTFRRWAGSYFRVQNCLSTEAGTPESQMSCILGQDSPEPFALQASRLGFYAAGLHLDEFQNLLKSVYGDERAATLNTQLQETASMPRRSEPLSREAFADLKQWIEIGLPYLDELLQPYSGPSTCSEGLDPSLRNHLRETARDSWQSRNVARGMRMFGCGAEGACFQQQRDGQALFPERPEWHTAAGDHLHELAQFPGDTSYWIRASADGRFVAYGGDPSGILDLQSLLQRAAPPRLITVDAYYDPSFFPDDSAFVFQGNGTGICNMSILKDPATTHIDFSEDACTADNSVEIPLYQSIGASLDGSDYLAAVGEFQSDSGFRWQGNDPFVRILNGNSLYLYPMMYDGQRWQRGQAQIFPTPYELDWGLAPSNRLIVSRKGPSYQHVSYEFYSLRRPQSDQPYEKKPLGSLCLSGLKGNFSFDDRFFVTYGYIKPEHAPLLGYASAEDPEFQALLAAGTANIFLFDLWTQKKVAVTRMGADQYALFPHFRSDGWLYFMVFDRNRNERLLLSSDAALKAQRADPMND